jgi:hypothetical protein
MDAPDTVTEAMAELRAAGYGLDVDLVDGVLRASDGQSCDCTQAVVERVYRFEGESDPGDESIVLGLRLPGADRGAVLVSAYGPAADPAMAEQLAGLVQRAPRTP